MQDFASACRKARQLGLAVTYPAPGIVERIGADWDWLWIDGQHGEMGYNDLLGFVRACDAVKRPAIVRVAGHEFGEIGKVLDMGASGVIVPCVDTAEQARAIVNAAKFPPLGKRSYGGRRVGDVHGRNYSDRANESVLLIAQIESPEAVDNVEEIAAIPGIDALFLGPDDLMLRRGFSMTAARNRESLGKDMEAVSRAARANGKLCVMVGASQEMLKLCLSMGFNMIVGGADVVFLSSVSKQNSTEARNIIKDATHSSEPVLLDHSGQGQTVASTY